MENDPTFGWMYIVTNWHVVKKASNPVVRINRKDGTADCIETEESYWRQHPAGDDIGILRCGIGEDLKVQSIPTTMFLTRQLVEDEDVGIGDDSFMIGRFINHEGRQQNAPAVRFGNIAMMPKEPIKSLYGINQESFLLEIRSLPGYSGSAVILYSPCAMNDMSTRRFGKPKAIPEFSLRRKTREQQEEFAAQLGGALWPKGPYLLGIDWCHLQARVPLIDKDGKPVDGLFVEQNSGMAGVIPAWKILEAINSEEQLMARRKDEKRFLEQSSRVSLD